MHKIEQLQEEESMPNRAKISLIGGGNIGGVLALSIAEKELADVFMFDLPQKESFIQGKMLDIAEALPVIQSDVNLIGTTDYSNLKDSDVIIITAGFPRKPGMTRDDLVNKNLNVINQIARDVKTYAPNAFCIVVTNPLDAMVYAFYKTSGLSSKKVCGMAGVLDSSRFRYFVAKELNVSVKDVQAMVMGGHGPTMVPLVRLATVGNIPLTEMLDKESIDKIVERTREAGTEIVQLMVDSSAFVSPALSAVEMAESYLKDQKRVLTCAAYLNGEFGIQNYFIGVPAIIGSEGIEKIVEFSLTDEEKAMLDRTYDAVQKTVASTGL